MCKTYFCQELSSACLFTLGTNQVVSYHCRQALSLAMLGIALSSWLDKEMCVVNCYLLIVGFSSLQSTIAISLFCYTYTQYQSWLFLSTYNYICWLKSWLTPIEFLQSFKHSLSASILNSRKYLLKLISPSKVHLL